MKKLLLTSCFTLISIITLFAQPILFGMTTYSGKYRKGSIYKYNAGNKSIDYVYDFNEQEGYPINSIIKGNNGQFYLMTIISGDITQRGTIFSYDPTNNNLTKVGDLGSSNDAFLPQGDLLLAKDGKLYGTTYFGGTHMLGVLFSLEPNSGKYTKLFDFDNNTGALPSGFLIQATDGKLYGLARQGGEHNSGTIFSYDLTTSTFQKLHDFNVVDGYIQEGGLFQAPDGKLYGVSANGGANFAGVLFSFDPKSSIFEKLFDFGLSDGGNPVAPLLLAPDGKLYGAVRSAAKNGRGALFSYDYKTSTYTKLYDFKKADGLDPIEGLKLASNGKIYGVMASGGTERGTIFSYHLSSSTFLKEHDFMLGAFPSSHLLEDICTSIPKVNIPDAKALNVGVNINTVYIGYSPASSITLTAEAKEGNGEYSYLWSNGATTPSINISPSTNTTYSVRVTDKNGCRSDSAGKIIQVIDVHCGNNNDKVQVCKEPSGKKEKGHTLCISATAVMTQLSNGAYLGSCGNEVLEQDDNGLQLQVSPNPSTDNFSIIGSSRNNKDRILLKVTNATGRIMEVRTMLPNQSIQIGSSYQIGIYYVEIVQGNQKLNSKLIKTN